VLSAAGQQLSLPLFVTSTPVAIAACLPHPSTATFGAKLIQAEFTITGVFSPTTLGAWISIWLPWNADGSAVNEAGTVASPAAIAPGAVTVAARRAGARGVGALVSGRVTQAGQPRGGASVQIFGGTTRSNVRRLGRVRANANGAFTFRARRGTFFRASAVAAAGAAPPLCTQLAPQISPIPCVNPTVNGFTAQSRIVRKR
jgi:hypothetical protein